MLDTRYHVSFSDVAESYIPAMRHRIMLNFEGQAEGIDNDELLRTIIEETPKTLDQNASVK
jgi:MoxR-like ATPase